MARSHNQKGNAVPKALKVVVAVVVAVALIVGGALAGITLLQQHLLPFNPTGDPSKDLVVMPDDVLPDNAVCKSDKFLKNSLPNKHLLWSDAVSTPFASTDPVKEFKEILKEDCQNPTKLLDTLEGLAATKIDDNTTIGDINPWMKDAIKMIKAGMGDGVHAIGVLTHKDGHGDKLYVVPEVQKVAALVNTILLRLDIVGNRSVNSESNRHVVARDGLAVGKLPIATLNDEQEKGLTALVLQYSEKTGCAELQIGFDAQKKGDRTGGDKRFLGLAPPECKTTTKPGCETQGDCDTSRCLTDCTTDHPTCEEQNGGKECKDGSQDPVQQGNAPQGGGTNDTTGPGPKVTPTHPPVTYTPPANDPPPSGSGGGGNPSPDPAPAPPPETQAPPVSNPSSGTSCPPGVTSC